MGLETGTYVSDLVASNPLGTDSNAQGDDHIRLLKSVLQATFPNASKAYYFDDVLPVKTGAFNVQTSHMNALVPCDTSAVGFTVTLPPVLSVGKGFTVFVVLETAGNTLTVSAALGETINGNASVSLNTQYVMLRLVTDGNKWFASYLGTVFYTDAEATQLSANTAKLAGIETGATADQTPAEIKAAYESNVDTNAFTDAEKALLANQSGVNTGDEVSLAQSTWETGTDTTEATIAPSKLSAAIYALSPFGATYTHVIHQEASGVSGANTVAGWQVRPLNTIDVDNIGITLASNQVTIPAGTYIFDLYSYVYLADRSKIRLFDVTNSAVLFYGPAAFLASAHGVCGPVTAFGKVTFTASTTVQIDHYCQSAATLGLGVATSDGSPEVYGGMHIWKVV